MAAVKQLTSIACTVPDESGDYQVRVDYVRDDVPDPAYFEGTFNISDTLLSQINSKLHDVPLDDITAI